MSSKNFSRNFAVAKIQWQNSVAVHGQRKIQWLSTVRMSVILLCNQFYIPRNMQYLLILLAFLCATPLVIGASSLGSELMLGIPMGNFLAAGLFVSWSSALYRACGTPLGLLVVSRISLIFAISWLPVSIALSGNPYLQFSDDTILWWLGYTGMLTTALLVLSLIVLIQSVRQKIRSKAEKDASQ
ncbi:MAG TPA: hypothetical protein DCS87_00885 [Rheinheimera sp.]|nr:hypothetical protein [Rheinheimera sp.]